MFVSLSRQFCLALLGIATLAGGAAASDGCKLFAEVSVEAVSQGAMLICLRTGNPLACAIATASEDVATKEVAKTGAELGCDWVVRKLGDKLVISATGPDEKIAEMEAAKAHLKQVRTLKMLH